MRFTDPTGMFEAGMMRAGKNASIQERSEGKDTQNMEGETDGLDEGKYQNLQNSVLGFLDAQGTEDSNNNTSKGGLQTMADAGRFSFWDNKDVFSLSTLDKSALTVGVYTIYHKLALETDMARWLRYGKDVSPFTINTFDRIGKGANLVGSIILITNLKRGYYSSKNGPAKPLEGLGDSVFNILGFSGIGTPASIFYYGPIKHYMKWYEHRLNTNKSFEQREWDRVTNTGHRDGAK